MKSLLTTTLLANGSLKDVLRKMLLHLSETQFYNEDCTFGFNGKLLQENIRQEWLLSQLYRSDEPTFLTSCSSSNYPNDSQVFNVAVQCAEKLPFSLINFRSHNVESFKDDEEANRVFYPNHTTTTIEKITFCHPAKSTAFFHKQQRERRIWWRKFSSLPGRFATTEVTTEETTGVHSVEITAEFAWCRQIVETVKHQMQTNDLLVKDGRNQISPHIISCEWNLDRAASIYLCDAYDPINEEGSRDMLRFHRKLAPYKVTFAISGSTANISRELQDLALVLARKIRALGIVCELLADTWKKSLESIYRRADAMGVPYTIVLSDKTLQDGILGLRSRDTTLKEQSHVSMVVPYLEKIMKSY